MNAQAGVEARTYEELETGAVVAVTAYDSREDVEAALRAVAAAGIRPEYNPEQESQPRRRYVLVRVDAQAGDAADQ